MNTSSSPHAILFACLLWTIIPNTSTLTIRCNPFDKQALLNFKHRLIDPSNILSSWSTQHDCCQWKGVTCHNITSRVTQLTLPCSTTLPSYRDTEDKSHCLTGSIYLSFLLVELQFLTYLDLSNNDFLAIQFHYSLHSQDSYNNLSVATTPLPRQSLNSSTLRHLDLSENYNLAINSLQWLSNISSLEYLDLSYIDLYKETNWLQLVTTLPSLSVLNMQSCQLQDLSSSLQYANFTALEFLYLSKNEFNSELPKWLFNLNCSINELAFSSSSLKGPLPKALLNFRQLEFLDLAINNLDGPIPYWLGEFQFLQTLMLGINMFSGSIPTSLGNLSSLAELDVGSNNLSGIVSEKNFVKLSKLMSLWIALSPPLIFDFDSHWIPPFQLEELDISFAGPNIPVWLYTQRSIERLYIEESSFEAQGKFWNFVSRMTGFLDLNGNSIDGNLTNVLLNARYIDLSSTGLKGSLPRLSPNVAFVNLSNNSLSGDITPLMCDQKTLNGKTNLVYLDVSVNHLSGGLTNCWKNWKSLVYVNMGSNNLTGHIPTSMGLLSNLTSLHLHENNLYGEIPPSLQNCHSLLIFNARNNVLSGNIPNWIPHGVKALQLRSNSFSGNIPVEMCQMSSLIILDIANNTISGNIPYCLGNITALAFNNASQNTLSFSIFIPLSLSYYYIIIVPDNLKLVTKGQESEYGHILHFVTLIDMSSNNLSGTVPTQLFSLTGLISLNLSHNKLTGKIPNEIGNMKKLESLDFSRNQLWGEIPESLSSLSFLSYLNLSYNNLTGKIPLGTQLQGFSEFSYIGNHDLCETPLTKLCSQAGKSKDTKGGSESEFLSWFYIGIESGFVTGFLGVCSAIFLKKKIKWRHTYFKFFYDLRDRIYAMLVIKINSFCQTGQVA